MPSAPLSQSRLWLAYLGLSATALFWAGNAVVARATAGDIPPLALAFWRWTIALVLILPFGLPLVRKHWPTIRQRWRSLLPLGVLSVGTFNTLLYLSAQSTGAINIALINSTIPVVVALFAWLLLAERVSAVQATGIFTAMAGMLLIVARGTWQTLAALSVNPGDLIMVGAVFVWGIYSVLLRRQFVPIHPVALLTVLIALGLPCILPFYLWEIARGETFSLTWSHVPVFAYVGLFPSILAYLFWNHGVHTAGPSRAAVFIYLLPVFAALLAVTFLDEALHGYHGVGAGLILIGLYLATRPRRSP